MSKYGKTFLLKPYVPALCLHTLSFRISHSCRRLLAAFNLAISTSLRSLSSLILSRPCITNSRSVILSSMRSKFSTRHVFRGGLKDLQLVAQRLIRDVSPFIDEKTFKLWIQEPSIIASKWFGTPVVVSFQHKG